jgi:formylglycine-generating enzyme
LNAVADSDPNALYDDRMSNPSAGSGGYGGIARAGGPGSYTYSVIAGRGDMPVNWVTFYDALRFANWMNNGQPVGAQGPSTTENGAYTITQAGIDGETINRNASALVVVPTENEWYKAAYYDTITMSYFDYPTGSNTISTCSTPTAIPNRANCEYAVGDLTIKGSYIGSVSPNGTFDQGGNVWEWNEAKYGFSLPYRGIWGGGFANGSAYFTSAIAGDSIGESTRGYYDIGFRLAYAPEPSTGLLVIGGLLGFAGWRRART